MTALILAIFAFVYLGMAAGRVPGLRLDRTGIALVGAIVLVAAGAVDAAGIRAVGVRLDFITHARCGIPIALLSFAFAGPWLAWIGS